MNNRASMVDQRVSADKGSETLIAQFSFREDIDL
jgi:hypothetical protein